MKRWALVCACAAAGSAGMTMSAAAGPPSSGDEQLVPSSGSAQFATTDRRRLARDADGRVRVLIAGRVGDGDRIAALARSKGGTVSTNDDKAGFVIAELPAERALELEGAGALTAVGLDRNASQPRPEPTAGADAEDGFVPYVATREIGAPQFIASHPGYDGRGVKVAMLDTGVDWTAPGLQTTSTGTRKVTRIYDLRRRPPLITDRVVSVSEDRFEVDGATYELPPDLTHERVRFGSYSERAGTDVNLDGDAGTDRFGVAVVDSPEHGLVVFLDTDQDLSFADETTLSDWNTSHRSATFGEDDPDTTDAVEVRPFSLNECRPASLGACATTARERGDGWSLNLAHHHATMVASTAAGHDFGPGGEHFDGVAPGAEVWSMLPFGDDAALWDSEIANSVLLAAQRGVDVMNMSTTLLNPLGPPADPVTTLIDNVAQAYGMITVVGNGNAGPGLQALGGSPGTARSAVTVNAMLSSTSLERLFERPGIPGDRLIYYSSHGPQLDGRWNPDVVAPTASLTADTRWTPPEPGGTAQPTTHPSLPTDYKIGSGTSNAAPFVTGALALLISGARAEGIPYTAHTLKRALELGAAPLTGAPDHAPEEIGHGIVNVERAFNWLRRLGAEGAIDRDVDTVAFNDVLGSGQGIYQRGTRRDVEQVTLTTSETAARRYRLRVDQGWIRLDRKRLDLPAARDRTPGTATFKVRIDPTVRARAGVHTGVVSVDDPITLDPADHEMLVTVVTPHRFDADNRLRYTGRHGSGIKAEEYRQFFVHVPPGAQSLAVELSRPRNDPAGVLAFAYDGPGGLSDYSGDIAEPPPGGTSTRTFPNPTPGTWEVSLYAHEIDRRGPVVPRHAYDVTMSLTSGQPDTVG